MDKQIPNRIDLAARRLQRWHTWLLGAYPPGMRAQFRDEMADVFTDLVEDAAGQGMAALTALGARETLQTAAAITRVYAGQGSGVLRRLWRWLSGQDLGAESGGADGRSSWRLAWGEVSLFIAQGAAMLALNYLLPQSLPDRARAAWQVTGLLAFLLPVLWLLAGLARGMPRWAYPAIGGLLGSGLVPQPFYDFGLFYVYLASAAGVLIALEVVFGQRRDALYAAGSRLLRRVGSDPFLLAFAMYGMLPLAIMRAFENEIPNGRGPWLLLAVVAMLAGALGYARARSWPVRVAPLALGVALPMLAAVRDHHPAYGLTMVEQARLLDQALSLALWVFAPTLALLAYKLARQLAIQTKYEFPKV